MSTLFEQLGGDGAVDAAVDIFYDKVLVDGRIKHLFVGVDMAKLRTHQKNFLTYAFGGASQYGEQNVRGAHARLVNEMGLDDSHFDVVVENLANTLKQLNVPGSLIDEVALIAESVRYDVLNR